jgi:hypothetical protein
MLNNRLLKHSLLAILIGYFFSVIFLFGHEYWRNYSNRNGNVLANGRLLGGDFLCFYVAGKMFNEERENLYNLKRQFEIQKTYIPTPEALPGVLPFVYPPFVAAFFSVFSRLDFAEAYGYWTLCSIIFFATGLFVLIETFNPSPIRRLYLYLFIGSFVPFIVNCLGGGQTSTFGFLLVALFLHFIKNQKFAFAGIALGCGVYKFPLFIVLGLCLLILGKLKVVLNAFLSSSLIMILSMSLIGRKMGIDYLSVLSNYRYGGKIVNDIEMPINQGVGYFSFISSIFKNQLSIAYMVLLISILVVLVCCKYFQKIQRVNRKCDDIYLLSVCVSLSLFFSLQMINYDLTILLAPLIAIISKCNSRDFLTLVATTLPLHFEWLIREAGYSVSVSSYAPALFFVWVSGLVLVLINDN